MRVVDHDAAVHTPCEDDAALQIADVYGTDARRGGAQVDDAVGQVGEVQVILSVCC